MSDEQADGVGVNVEVELRFSSDHELKEEDQKALGTMAFAGALIKAFRDQSKTYSDLMEYVSKAWWSQEEEQPA